MVRLAGQLAFVEGPAHLTVLQLTRTDCSHDGAKYAALRQFLRAFLWHGCGHSRWVCARHQAQIWGDVVARSMGKGVRE